MFLPWVLFVVLWVQEPNGEERRVFAGEWKNNRATNSGNLHVEATKMADHWKAKFVGDVQGKPFEFDGTMKASKPEGKQGETGEKLKLRGMVNVDGQTYTWSGYMTETILYGKYSSTDGDEGVFQLSRREGG